MISVDVGIGADYYFIPLQIIKIKGRKPLVGFRGHLDTAPHYLYKIGNYLVFEYFRKFGLVAVQYLTRTGMTA